MAPPGRSKSSIVGTNLSLVGIVDADAGLFGGDPRAIEKTFNLLQQVGQFKLVNVHGKDHCVLQAKIHAV